MKQDMASSCTLQTPERKPKKYIKRNDAMMRVCTHTCLPPHAQRHLLALDTATKILKVPSLHQRNVNHCR